MVTVILLVILAGVTINFVVDEDGIFNNATNAVEKSNIATWKEKIELDISKTIIISDRDVSIEEIISQLEKDEIISAGDSNTETGQVKTKDGYIYEITENKNGNWNVEYVGKGEIAKTELLITLTQNTTGLTNKVTINIVAKADSGIKSYAPQRGTVKTYASGTKQISESYEVSSNGTYTFTITNNNGKTESKTITISNILEGAIGITTNLKEGEWTNKEVTVTITWPTGSSKGIQEIRVGEGIWQTVTGETSTVTTAQNTTIRARISNSSTEIIANSITITKIDKTTPTVTATEGTDTITEGDSKEVSSYFTVSNGGQAPVTIKYTVNGNTISNTNTLTAGTYTITCTATKATGAVASATKTVVVEAKIIGITTAEVASDASYIGKYVNYTVPSGGDSDVKWRIFYADNDNIYLIASDYLKYNYVPTKTKDGEEYKINGSIGDYKLLFNRMVSAYTGSADITDPRITKWMKWVGQYPSSENTNIRSIAYMLDIGIWNPMYANNYAEYAIGGPTIEMFCASYKATHPSRYIECGSDGWNDYGYQVKWSDGSYNYYVSGLSTSELENLYVISDTSKASAYWLASPSAAYNYRLLDVFYNGKVTNTDYNYFQQRSGFACCSLPEI